MLLQEGKASLGPVLSPLSKTLLLSCMDNPPCLLSMRFTLLVVYQNCIKRHGVQYHSIHLADIMSTKTIITFASVFTAVASFGHCILHISGILPIQAGVQVSPKRLLDLASMFMSASPLPVSLLRYHVHCSTVTGIQPAAGNGSHTDHHWSRRGFPSTSCRTVPPHCWRNLNLFWILAGSFSHRGTWFSILALQKIGKKVISHVLFSALLSVQWRLLPPSCLSFFLPSSSLRFLLALSPSAFCGIWFQLGSLPLFLHLFLDTCLVFSILRLLLSVSRTISGLSTSFSVLPARHCLSSAVPQSYFQPGRGWCSLFIFGFLFESRSIFLPTIHSSKHRKLWAIHSWNFSENGARTWTLLLSGLHNLIPTMPRTAMARTPMSWP